MEKINTNRDKVVQSESFSIFLLPVYLVIAFPVPEYSGFGFDDYQQILVTVVVGGEQVAGYARSSSRLVRQLDITKTVIDRFA
jgi:hypothetical protein